MKKLGIILFILIVIYFIFLIRQDIIDNLELKRETQRVKEGIQKEMTLAEKLRSELKALKSNRHIEKLARIRLGLVKKGEVAYKVINN